MVGRKLVPVGSEVGESFWADIDGPYHYLDFGGAADGPVFVCLHGLSGSSQNWSCITPTLTKHGRVLAVDLVGFGRTGRHGRAVTLAANQAYLDRFLRQVAGTPVILIAHSMGATIATIQAARHPQTVAGLVVINPAVPWQFQDQVSPALAAALGVVALAGTVLPRSARGRYTKDLNHMFFDFLRFRYTNLPAAVLAAMARNIEVGARLGGRTRDAQTRAALHSLVSTLGHRRQFATLARRVQAPVLVLHGDRDRLVPPGAISAIVVANPSWRLHVAHGIGHFPPLEVPQWTTDRIVEWVRSSVAS